MKNYNQFPLNPFPMRHLLIIVATVLAISAAREMCYNPVFRAQKGVFSKYLPSPPALRTAPDVQTNNFFCPTYQNARSCCSSRTLIDLNTAWRRYRTDFSTKLDKILETVTLRLNWIDEHITQITAEWTSNYTAVREASNIAMTTAATACRSEILAYTQGVLCVGCSPVARQFYDDEVNDTILVDSKGFARVTEACATFVSEYDKLTDLVDAQTRKVYATWSRCAEHTVRLTDDEEVTESVRICVSNDEVKLRRSWNDYLRHVARSMYSQLDIQANYTVKYAKETVSVCDVTGCDELKISAEAKKVFARFIPDESNITRSESAGADATSAEEDDVVVIIEKVPVRRALCRAGDRACIVNSIEEASTGLFFDVDRLFSDTVDGLNVIGFADVGGYDAWTVTPPTTAKATVPERVEPIEHTVEVRKAETEEVPAVVEEKVKRFKRTKKVAPAPVEHHATKKVKKVRSSAAVKHSKKSKKAPAVVEPTVRIETPEEAQANAIERIRASLNATLNATATVSNSTTKSAVKQTVFTVVVLAAIAMFL